MLVEDLLASREIENQFERMSYYSEILDGSDLSAELADAFAGCYQRSALAASDRNYISFLLAEVGQSGAQAAQERMDASFSLLYELMAAESDEERVACLGRAHRSERGPLLVIAKYVHGLAAAAGELGIIERLEELMYVFNIAKWHSDAEAVRLARVKRGLSTKHLLKFFRLDSRSSQRR
jgi:hypothetical protein